MSDDLVLPEGTPKKNEEILMSVLRNITEAQAKDSEVRKLELEVKSEEIASHERVAMKSIDAQERSFIDNRTQYNKHLIHRYIFIAVLTVVIGAIAIAMIMNNAKDVIIDSLKLVLAFGSGAFGGFYAGKSKKQDPDES